MSLVGFTERQRAVVDRVRTETTGEIRRIEPAPVGVLVVQRLPDESTSSLFHVTLEPSIHGAGSLHWQFLGPVEETASDYDQTRS